MKRRFDLTGRLRIDMMCAKRRDWVDGIMHREHQESDDQATVKTVLCTESSGKGMYECVIDIHRIVQADIEEDIM